MPQTLKQRAAELERRVKERAEEVKKVLREYRETARASSIAPKGAAGPRARARLLEKRLDVERANAEYMRVQRELERLLLQMRNK